MKKFVSLLLLSSGAFGLTTALTALPAFASPAATSNTGTFNGYGAGYSNVIGTTAANTVILKINGQNIPTYCVNQSLSLNTTAGTIFSPVSATQVENTGVTATNLAYASDIAVNGASIGTPLSNPNDEAASEQLAIWHFTNNLNYSSVGDPTLVARANQLVADASPLTPTTSFNYSLSATYAASGNTNLVSVKLVNSSGTGVANQTINVSGGPVSTITTNQSGIATLTEPGTASANLLFSWTGTIAAGSFYMPSGSSQPLITTTSVPTTQTTPLVVTPIASTTTTQPAPTTTQPAPTTTQPAPPTTVVPKTSLPYTGSWVTPTLIWGSLSLMVAAGAALLIRKHQIR